jgi:protein prenyltransferase alpha subunit repeat containing protein 1
VKPQPTFPFVLVEGNLGIPKKILVGLYMTAIGISLHTSDVLEATAVSCVFILLNPSHQTALNTRKRLIQDGHIDPSKELIFTELLMRGSPDAGKQSIIWDHRRWCLRNIHGVMGPSSISLPGLQHWASSEEVERFPSLTSATIRHELSIIQRTCETYPRNYHAWSQWNFMINVCYASIYTSDDGFQDFFAIIVQEVARLRSWVDQHISDYSAMHQLCQAQKLVDYLALSDRFRDIADGTQNSLTLTQHSHSLVTIFPSYESLWMYLRVSLANLDPKERMKILQSIDASVPSTSDYFRKQLLAWHV